MTEKPRTSRPKTSRARSTKPPAGEEQGKPTPGGNGPWWHEPSDPEAAHADAVGSATDEAAKLAGALADFASRAGLAEVVRGFAAQTAGGVKAAATKASQTAGRGTAEPGDEAQPEAEVIEVEVVEDDAGWDDHAEHGEVYVICDECPVCLGMEFLRETQPEIAESVAEAMSAFTVVVRNAIDAWADSSARGSRVEHIDLD